MVLSLAVHALFCALCWFFLQDRAIHRPSEPIWVQVDPPRKSKAKQDDFEKRVVQSDAGREAKQAAPDAYLGERTRVVDRETVNSGKTIQVAKPGSSARTMTQDRDRESRRRSQSRPSGERSAADTRKLSMFGLPILPDARRKGASEELAKDTPEWANVGAGAQDYIEGIKESDRTALNTREYLYFGYHQRIRQKLELEWTRLLRQVLVKFYKSGRRLADDTEYTTRLLVILNDKGEITRIKVLGVSGTQELDDVATQAFNKAGPFPNPPKGLIRNGEVEVPWELKLRS